jgi:hypothetical protein
MYVARKLRRRKSNLAQALANTVTMYAPGVYPVPYATHTVLIGGRGASGNSPTGGNYASGGNQSSNPTLMGGNAYTTYYDFTNGGNAYSNNDHPWGPSYSTPSPYVYYANPGAPGSSYVNYFVSYYVPGNTYYNPVYYNPYYPGTDGAMVGIGGVVFPGGPAGNPAPIVPSTLSNLKYQQSGISITVPSGGYVTITPVGQP